MTDLSRIDFTRLTLQKWSNEAVRCQYSPARGISGGITLDRSGHEFAILMGNDMVWRYAFASWGDLLVAKMYTDQVDAFIVAECARIAKEDEAANWVVVPWQDVEWLSDGRTTVRVNFGDGEIRDWNQLMADGSRLYRKAALPFDTITYYADRRTFPAGYDPTKPRWVEVDWRDVTRLEGSGATIAYTLKDGTHLPREYVETVGVKPRYGQRYAVDIHTLKPGVSLHVETETTPDRDGQYHAAKAAEKPSPEKQAKFDELMSNLVSGIGGAWNAESPPPGWWERAARALWGLLDDISTLDDACRSNDAAFRSSAIAVTKLRGAWLNSPDGYRLEPNIKTEPKHTPRQCTRDFALRHPDESEWRVQQHDGLHASWSTWQPMSRVPLFQPSVDDYEFRTTAREPERRQVTVEFDGKRWTGELVEQ